MIIIKPLEDRRLIQKVFKDQTLREASLPDEILDQFVDANKKVDIGKGLDFLEVRDGFRLLGLIAYKQVSLVTVDVHWFILSKYWGKGYTEEIQHTLEKYFRNHTKYHKIISQVPESCKQVLKSALDHGYQPEGLLSGAAFWRGKVEDLVILSKFIRRTS